jgi:putative addiction module component (TIGR02574 family)
VATRGFKRTSFAYYPGVLALPSVSAPKLLNRSFTITAGIEMVSGSSHGAGFTLGGSDGGFGLYVRERRPVFVGNFLKRSLTRVTSQAPLAAGPVTLRADFAYWGGFGEGGTMTLFVDGKKVSEGRMAETQGITLGLGGERALWPAVSHPLVDERRSVDNQPMSDRAFNIDDLSPEERLQLLDRLWESLRSHPEELPLTAAQREELDRRLDELNRGKRGGIPWEEVLERLRKRDT